LIVEAAETAFVPLCVYNNRAEEAAILKSFGEPAWNNPVVRVVDAERKDLVDRLAGDWSLAGLTRAMVAGLEAAHREVPTWLALLAREEDARGSGLSRAVFGMT
jgi:hypothetical protein